MANHLRVNTFLTFLFLLSRAGAPAAWHPIPGGRWQELAVPERGQAGFRLVSCSESGIAFTNTLTETAGAANRTLYNGSGVALGDFDGDERADIFLCSLEGRSALYRNLGGWRFEDVTAAVGFNLTNLIGRGAVLADVNADRRPDLLLAAHGEGVRCFFNAMPDGFVDATGLAGTASRHGSVTLALADIDGNATLDLYVVNNRADDIRDRGFLRLPSVGGKAVVPAALRDRLLIVDAQLLEYGEPDRFLLNDGNGRFKELSWTNGAFADETGRTLVEPPRDWGLSASWRDINSDGAPDLYICNDFWTPDRLWLNDGQGRFRAIELLALRQTSGSSMGVDFADLDRDGELDFLVVDMLSRDWSWRKRQAPAQPVVPNILGGLSDRPQSLRNTLFRARGDGTFAEIANFSGVAASEWSWQPLFLDVDLDGYEDLLVSSGHVHDVQDMDAEAQVQARQRSLEGIKDPSERRRQFTLDLMTNMQFYPRLETPVLAYRNLGSLRFAECTAQWGTDQPGVHHGLATADLDGDGDLDLVVNNLASPAGLYRNETTAPRVAVRLRGRAPNTQGIGARVRLLRGALPMQSQEVISGGRYASGGDPLLVFAAGTLTNQMTLEVRWRSGRFTRMDDVAANRLYEVDEAAATGRATDPPLRLTSTPAQALFEDVSARLDHTHHEEAFDDFARQPLVPRRLSQAGPGVAWLDLNGDRVDELIVGSGRGGRMGVFRNDGRGMFRPWTEAPFDTPLARDQVGVAGWRSSSNSAVILAAGSNYEEAPVISSPVQQFDPARRSVVDLLPGETCNAGPVALSDLDGDGDLDLFVGGRCVPGRYPEPTSSLLFRREDTGWVRDDANCRRLEGVGLVNGAVWSDLDNDGAPELVLACEWGPIRIFRNQRGQLVSWDPTVSNDAPTLPRSHAPALASLTGWWNGVTTGDFDGDGRMDIVAANWGLNSEAQPAPDRPERVFWGDLSGSGGVDVIETVFDPGLNAVTPRWGLNVLGTALPWLRSAFPSYAAFSAATLEQVLGHRRAALKEAQATTLESIALMNRGDSFVCVPLPREAQLAPAYGVNVADFDGDGHEDVFLSQNFFATRPGTPRLDAGRGLLLLGEGAGSFRSVPGQESGILVYGEQRGSAMADFDRDGRMDLVVTQNGAATRLFRNRSGKPGVRVQLRGPPGNPDAIGAVARLKSGEAFGPAREIHAGSGYVSQDAATQVLALPDGPSPVALWVRWPGGRTSETPLPRDAREISVSLPD